MKKNKYFRCIFLLLSAFVLITFSFKDHVYSKSNSNHDRGYESIAIDTSTDRIFAVKDEKGIDVIDVKTGAITNSILINKEIKAIAIDEQRKILVIAEEENKTISIISFDTLELLSSIPIKNEPQSIAIDSELGLLLITDEKDKLTAIDLNTNQKIKEIKLSKKPDSIATDSGLHLAVIVHHTWGKNNKGEEGEKGKEDDDGKNKNRDNITIIDLKTLTIIKTLQAGKNPVNIAINPLTHEATITNEKSNDLTIIDLNALAIKGTIPVEKHPIALSYNQCLNTLSVIGGEDKAWMQLIDMETWVKKVSYTFKDELKDIKIHPYLNKAALAGEQGLNIINLPNPVPQLTSITPEKALRGQKSFSFTLNGKGLLEITEIYLNGTKANSTFLECGSIKVDVSEEYLKKTGDIEIKALNPTPEGGTSNPLYLKIENPIPTISALDPLEVMAGTPGLTLTVYGTGFFVASGDSTGRDDTTVYINATPRTFTLISQTKIQTGLTSEDLEYGRYLDIKASNPSPGGGTSNTAKFTVLNPIPSLTSITPASITAESPDFILTLTGDNFVKTSLMSFNNLPYPANYISKTQITATIPSDAIKTDGSYQVKVINPLPGGGMSSAIVFTVNKKITVQPLPEGSFGKQYEDLVPQNATIKAYDPKRFCMITGIVKDKSQNPLSGVTVSIHSHPEYGTVTTNSEGRFSIPVNGGGTITVVYEKSGYITTHRQVNAPWNDIAIAETITMTSADAIATTVNFDGSPSTITTHKSTTITDGYGTRSLTMVFSGDNKAYAKASDGTEVILSSITTRATEFETPESMPAKLPPNSAFTYASELSVDGAKNVRFEKPIMVYVDNFLGFRVGEKVPVGYYDRDRAVWVPSDNGVVVRLLDTNGDGIVDALDNVGDGLPHDFNVAGLTDPAKYKPNSTYWRVSVNHFTPWDCNWPFGPPAGATPPNPEGQPSSDGQQDKDDCDKTNSYCERRNRIFHEDIPLPGTDMTLHYASNRVKGYKPAITIPASGITVPSSLKSIIVQMDVAGRKFETTLSPLPNQKAEFVWDGLDYLGKPVGSTTANISIGFVYAGVYQRTERFGYNGNGLITGVIARQEVTSWKRSTLIVQRGEGITSVAAFGNGWTLSAHHYLNPSDSNTLYKGDGTTSKNNVRIITTVAGSGGVYQWGFNFDPGGFFGGDGGTATNAGLNMPYEVAVDNAGNIYIADSWNHRIRKVDTSGIITTVAGRGWGWGLGDGVPATQASLGYPEGVSIDNAGNIYIADTGAHRIRKVDTNGIITTVAGSGESGWWGGGFSGDGGLATQAKLRYPSGVTVDNAGNIYIADTWNHRIRKVDTNGIITTIAGNGAGFLGAFGGDSGPATNAGLYFPSKVAVDNAGNIYIADSHNNRIRKVNVSGIITTVAGNGQWGYSGDGGTATQAPLSYPNGVAIDNAGNIYIAETGDHSIRKVDTNGIITTIAIAGKNSCWDGCFTGDGGLATKAGFHRPSGVAIAADGSIYVADSLNNRIRKVSYPSAFAGSTIAGDIAFADENGLGYIISSTGLHKSTIDLSTGKTLLTFGYNQAKQLISITDRFGNQTTIQRDSSGIPTFIKSPDGIVTSLTIDSSNNLTKATYPDNTSYSFTYTTDSLMTDEYNPKNNHFVHQFDSNGRITNISDPEGGTWNYSRTMDNAGNILVNVLTGEGNLTTYKDKTDSTGAYTSIKTEPSGAITTITRSSDGLTETEQLCGMKQSLKYDLDSEYKFKYIKESAKTSPAGLSLTNAFTKTYQDTNADKKPDLITETTTLNSKSWTMSNNVLTGIITNKSPLNRIITTQYDIANLLTKQITVTGLSSSNYTYDARGRLVGITTGSRTTAIAYDPNGNIDKLITPDNKTFDYTYDIMGRLKGELRPDGTVVQYSYDSNGNMTVLTNPKNIANNFNYTANDQRKTWTTPLSGSYLYSYDKERKLKTITFPSGKLITNAYTKGLLTSTQMPEGVTTFEYGCSNLLSKAVKGTESIAFAYDGSLLKTDTRSGLLNQSISYSYNNDFKLSSLSYAGSSYSLNYDNDNLLTKVGSFIITRNSQNGLPTSASDGTMTNTRAFSGYGELDGYAYKIGATDVYTVSLTRDQSGRITQRIENIKGEVITWIYSYDVVGRLTEVKKNNVVVENYSYDANGNRLSDTSRSYSYSTEDYIITVGTDSYQFSVDGFLTSKTTSSGTTNYNYSSRGELLSVTKPDGTVVTYDHDPMGRRIVKRINGTIVEKYLWQGMTQLLAVYDGNNNLISRFNYADGRMPVSMTYGGITYYLSYDQVDSLRMVADANGNIVKRLNYDSFGNIINDTNPSFSVPFGFAGGLHDRDTGLIRFGLRDYDPVIERWTAKDPIDFDGGDTNLFGYVGNNPVNFVDPLGLFNPTKAISAFLNSLNSGRLYASGSIKIAAAAGLDLTGVGIPAGTGVFLLGSWNIYSGTAAQRRAMQQWDEALNEKWSDATWKNLLGVLPFGEKYDDPCEPTPGEFLKGKYSTLKGKGSDILELLKELGTLGW